MKKKNVLVTATMLLFILLSLSYTNNNNLFKNHLMYINAIDKVYNSSITGMAVGVSKTNNLYGRDAKIVYTAAGNKDSNFSANTWEGIKLWEAKQLFLSIKSLKILRDGLPEILESEKTEYYLIHANHDYRGGRNPQIYYLTLLVNTKNYHIYMPKKYYEPNTLLSLSTEYVEYEPNEITKKLINDIITVK